MNFSIHLSEAVRSLRAAKQRSLLALIGIVIGVGSVIAMLTVGRMVQDEAMRQFKDMGTDKINIQNEFGAGGLDKSASLFRLDVAERLPAACPTIAQVAPSLQGMSEVFFKGRAIEQPSIIGVTAAFAAMHKLKMAEGRFLTNMDAGSRFGVIGSEISAQLQKAGASSPLGSRLRIDNEIFTVIGVLQAEPPGGMRQFDPNRSIFMHASSAQRLLGKADLNEITAQLRPGATTTQARDQITGYFSGLEKKTAVRVTSPEEMIAQMEKQMRMFTLLLGAIGSISLIVGGVGVMNVMLVSVTERRREIGIRRALGARRGDIRAQFLVESMILSLVGGVIGMGYGVATSGLIAYFAHWQFAISGPAMALGVGVSSVIGVFFGYYPARQASLLDPIAALRAE